MSEADSGRGTPTMNGHCPPHSPSTFRAMHGRSPEERAPLGLGFVHQFPKSIKSSCIARIEASIELASQLKQKCRKVEANCDGVKSPLDCTGLSVNARGGW